jgi:translation initiation factor IF-2
MVAMDLGIKFKKQKVKLKVEDNDQERLMERRSRETKQVDAAYEALPSRPPVVAVMGHVDHGKTTLMDALRRLSKGDNSKQKKTKSKAKNGASKTAAINGDVAGTEAGGITQAVSAFQVPLGEQNDAITFLDTPGHAAFSAMRQSGSSAADIIVLVIAADDGVQPQTVEILNMYKAIAKESKGGITMVVAMNKIDKPGIDVEESKRRIENQLLEHEIFPEGLGGGGDYGAPVQFFPISAKSGDGLDDLIEGLALQSEVMNLRADIDSRAEGIVMDASVEQGLGVVVDAIVRWGSIQRGDIAVSNTSTGKVRLLKDGKFGLTKSKISPVYWTHPKTVSPTQSQRHQPTFLSQ